VRAGRTAILIDIGFSARETCRRLALVGATPEDLSAILITHEHADHVAGAAVASRRWGVPLLCRGEVAEAARFAARNTGAREELPGGSFPIGDLQVTPFPVLHDAVETVGLVVEGEGIRAGYATDLGCSSPEVEESLENCHILAVEANHDVEMTREGPYPWHLKERILGARGHLSNEAAAALLARVIGPETREVLLAHISETNNAPELALVAARAGAERSRQPRVRMTAAEQGRPSAPIRL
jgi:phosphoribosyl 1,2-cyclic phosphodiesterase